MEISPWFVLVLGLATVFFGLTVMILLTKLMSALLAKNSVPAAPAAAHTAPPAPAPASARPAAYPIPDRRLFDAVVAAAIATYAGTESKGFRIHSIKPLSPAACATEGAAHSQFVAAVAAAIAEASGTEATGLRIHSIKRI